MLSCRYDRQVFFVQSVTHRANRGPAAYHMVAQPVSYFSSSVREIIVGVRLSGNQSVGGHVRVGSLVHSSWKNEWAMTVV